MDSPLSLIPTIDSLNEQKQNEDLIINIDPETRNNLQILGKLNLQRSNLYAKLASVILDNNVNLSDEELNSIIISYYYEYTKYRFPSNEFAFNPEFAQHNINHSHIIWHYYHLNHSQFKKIPFLNYDHSHKVIELITIYNNGISEYQKFRSKIRTALKRKEQREQGSIAGSIAIDFSGQQVAMEILSEAPGNQPHREISHTGSRPKDAEYLSSSSDGDLSDNDSQAELRLARAKREREISPVSCNTIESVKKSRITGPDDNISQITMTPSLVKASSTMPETDEVQVRRHQAPTRRIPDTPSTVTARTPRMKAGYDAALTAELIGAWKKNLPSWRSISCADSPPSLYVATSEVYKNFDSNTLSFGLYCSTPLHTNDCIGVLWGSRIAEDKLTDQNKQQRYIFPLADGHWLDGFNHRKNQVQSPLSFITDALFLPKFDNNCIMEPDGSIVAAKDIPPHTEILRPLSREYWLNQRQNFYRDKTNQNFIDHITRVYGGHKANRTLRRGRQETDSISSDEELSTTLTSKANISSKSPSNVHQLEQVAEQINMCIQSMNRHPVAQGGFTFADSVNDEYFASYYFLYNQLQERMGHFNKLSDDDSDLSMLQNLTSKTAKMFKLGRLVLKTANANFIVPFKTARKQLPDITDNALRYSSDYNMNLCYIAKRLDDLWDEMNECEWHNMNASTNSGNLIGVHYVSKDTTGKVINLIFSILNHPEQVADFGVGSVNIKPEGVLDFGVGSPYLIASLKKIWSDTNAIGIDLDPVVTCIQQKLEACGKKCQILRSIEFVSCDLERPIEASFLKQMQTVYHVITNFIGSVSIDEILIKTILPKSHIKIIMFRKRDGNFSKLHHEWLQKMGYSRFKSQFIGTLAFEEESFHIITYYRLHTSPVPEIDFGFRSAVNTKSDDFIAEEDDLSEVVDTYASKRLTRGVRSKSNKRENNDFTETEFIDLCALMTTKLNLEQKLQAIDTITTGVADGRSTGQCALCSLKSRGSTQGSVHETMSNHSVRMETNEITPASPEAEVEAAFVLQGTSEVEGLGSSPPQTSENAPMYVVTEFIRDIRGYSRNSHIRVSLQTYKCIKKIAEIANCHKDIESLANAIMSLIVATESEWKFELGIKHDREFYETISPDGSCGYLMDYVMTTKRFQMSVDEKNGMPTDAPFVDITIEEERDSVLKYLESVYHAKITNHDAFVHPSCIPDWRRRLEGCISFIKHGSRKRLPRDLWLSDKHVSLFRFNDSTPYSLFFHASDVAPYSDLLHDTRFLNIEKKFTYSQLLKIVDTCNFAVLDVDHFYPYRAHYRLREQLDESILDLCKKISQYLKPTAVFSSVSELGDVPAATPDIVADTRSKVRLSVATVLGQTVCLMDYLEELKTNEDKRAHFVQSNPNYVLSGLNTLVLSEEYYDKKNYQAIAEENECYSPLKLPNVLSNCYLNVVLEVLYSLPHFRKAVKALPIVPDHTVCNFFNEFKLLNRDLMDVWVEEYRESRMKQFVELFKGLQIIQNLLDFQEAQQDAAEALSAMLNLIDNVTCQMSCLRYTGNIETKNPLNAAAFAQFKAARYPGTNYNFSTNNMLMIVQVVRTCKGCRHTSEVTDSWDAVRLHFPKVRKHPSKGYSLRQMFAESFSPKEICMTCSECDVTYDKVSANPSTTHTEITRILRAPPVLVISLKRFASENNPITARVNFSKGDFFQLKSSYGEEQSDSLYSYDERLSMEFPCSYHIHALICYLPAKRHYIAAIRDYTEREAFHVVDDSHSFRTNDADYIYPNERNAEIFSLRKSKLMEAKKNNPNEADRASIEEELGAIQLCRKIPNGAYMFFLSPAELSK